MLQHNHFCNVKKTSDTMYISPLAWNLRITTPNSRRIHKSTTRLLVRSNFVFPDGAPHWTDAKVSHRPIHVLLQPTNTDVEWRRILHPLSHNVTLWGRFSLLHTSVQWNNQNLTSSPLQMLIANYYIWVISFHVSLSYQENFFLFPDQPIAYNFRSEHWPRFTSSLNESDSTIPARWSAAPPSTPIRFKCNCIVGLIGQKKVIDSVLDGRLIFSCSASMPIKFSYSRIFW